MRQSRSLDHAHLGQAVEIVAVVARHHLAVERRALRGGGDHRWPLARRSRARSADVTTSADATVALLAAVEQPQHRLDDPARRLVILERDRSLVEPRVGIRRRVRAVDDRDAPEVARSSRRSAPCTGAAYSATHAAGVISPYGAYHDSHERQLADCARSCCRSDCPSVR